VTVMKEKEQAPAGGLFRHDTLVLASGAAILDELEQVGIANQNRLRMLLQRGLPADDPDVEMFSDLIAKVEALAEEATDQIERFMIHQHPLGVWVKDTVGVGAKQAGRLLGEIGDPYWAHTVYEDKDTGEKIEVDYQRSFGDLVAYCGLHVQNEQAPRRRKGQQSNWNSNARKRLWLIADQSLRYTGEPHKSGPRQGQPAPRSPYRDVYETGREKYENATHHYACQMCGKPGHPAPVGTALEPRHQHARALRLVMREILRDIWQRSKEIHENQ